MRFIRLSLVAALSGIPVASRAHRGGHDARGVVTSVGTQELTIETRHGAEKFVLTSQTEFVRDGSPATAADIKPSDRAVVHARKKAGRLEAVQVQFAPAPKPKKQR